MFGADFLLDDDIVYLNHAAYDATPRPVLESYERWQRLLERVPVDFLSFQAEPRLQSARARLGSWSGATATTWCSSPTSPSGCGYGSGTA